MTADTIKPAPPTCTQARELLLNALDAGYGVAWKPGADTCGCPFITVVIASPDDVHQVTWHTHTTGTYRLHDALTKGGRRGWHDTTLKAVRTAITAADTRTDQ